jgi:GrpB-like predicted nucleotidyltransferase (UPF0157 family)
MVSGKTKLVQVVDYDPQWQSIFLELSKVIKETLGDWVTTIEHIGSTSVPGLAAKPIVDLTGIIETTDHLPEVIRALARIGYTHEGDLGIAGSEAFHRAGPDVPRDGSGRIWMHHHLYICARDNCELQRHLVFRDYLRAHPEKAQAYAELKKQLAQQFHHDIDSYIQGKSEFIETILANSQVKT